MSKSKQKVSAYLRVAPIQRQQFFEHGVYFLLLLKKLPSRN